MPAPKEKSLNKVLPRSPSSESRGDAKLLNELRRGNPSAFDAFYSAYFPRVYRYFQRRVAGVAEIEEATEAALGAIFEGVCRGRSRLPLERWIFSQVQEVARLSPIVTRGRAPARREDLHPVQGEKDRSAPT